jgi:ketosteroid isomerase-like protein
MASANLDLVRSILADWERGNYNAAEWAHPDIEYVYADGPAPGRWTGLDGMAEGAREWLSAWEDFSFEAEDYRELDSERVVVLTSFSGRGKTSGLELGQVHAQAAWLFHVGDGRVTRIVRYIDRERALADLGLAPDAGWTSS